MEQLYYIQNDGYIGNALVWWCANGKGYTSDIESAGKFTKNEARGICKRDEDTAWLCEYIDNLTQARKVIIDSQYVDYKKSIELN